MSDVRAEIKSEGARARHRIHPGPSGHDQRPLQLARADPDQALQQRSRARSPRSATRSRPPSKSRPGVVDVLNGIENTISGPSTTFRVNPSIAARLGFTAQEITTDATAIIDGVPATEPHHRERPSLHHSRPLRRRASRLLRRHSEHRPQQFHRQVRHPRLLATIERTAGEQEIRRENLQRNISVTGRLEGSDLGSGIQRVQAAVAALHLPSSVRIEYGGTYEEQQKSFAELGRVLILALALVFGVLLAEFRNLSAPISILTSSILSMSGVVLALLVTGTTFNVASFMGLIMVIGIVAKNGILLLDADQKFRDIGIAPRRAMILAGRRRLRPILMTALAAIAGMLPLAFALGAGSQMLQPLAIAVIGGLVISMLLSLVVTPVMYLLMHGEAQPQRQKSRKSEPAAGSIILSTGGLPCPLHQRSTHSPFPPATSFAKSTTGSTVRSSAGTSGRFGDVYNPASGELQAKVALATPAEVDTAVAAAAAAFPDWSSQPPLRRARVLFRFREIFERRLDEVAALLTSEHGKVFSDARGEATRGLEVRRVRNRHPPTPQRRIHRAGRLRHR